MRLAIGCLSEHPPPPLFVHDHVDLILYKEKRIFKITLILESNNIEKELILRTI
jgi:hypothetical protein